MRIIAGTARGRRFDAPKGMDTRPTLDRVKEALFGMLQFDIPGSSVLDLFSGSGNLGLEAASRGARRVLCNDRNRECAEQIRTNAKLLQLDHIVETQCKDFSSCIYDLSRAGERFDFVFLDAPYADGTAQRAAELICTNQLLQPGGRIVIEHATDLPPRVDDRLARMIQSRRYGSCAVSLYQDAGSKESNP
ncbi:MAG: 16S rRNA (guanine(966)-N(2))-methyltransferase RsmD [Christensenella sp.]|nr:16S rRNA (guanine(966)-N(2))-methyltransferase RsmD [Christensenella sp.]